MRIILRIRRQANSERQERCIMHLPAVPAVAAIFQVNALVPMGGMQFEEKEVAGNEGVVFRQIDEHTLVGTGLMMSNESFYLVEGDAKAVLIDAGTKIADLDKILISITRKPIMLVATHAHPDHNYICSYFSDDPSESMKIYFFLISSGTRSLLAVSASLGP